MPKALYTQCTIGLFPTDMEGASQAPRVFERPHEIRVQRGLYEALKGFKYLCKAINM